MRRAPSALALLLASAGTGLGAQAPAAAQAPAPPAAPALKSIRFEGGSGDDRLFALKALGLQVGRPCAPEDFDIALQALRLTDRFKTAEGSLAAGTGEALIRLEAWPQLRTWRFEGDTVPKALRKNFLFELRKGIRVGDLRLEELRSRAENRLQESGYPAAKVAVRREGDAGLVFSIALGAPALVRAMQITGEPGPYTPAQVSKAAGVKPGATLWTASVLREAQRGLRRRLLKDKRYEGTADPSFDPATGSLRVEMHAGPVVRLKGEGASFLGAFFGQKRLADLLPFTRSERYSPDQLDEGDRQVQRYFASRGFLDAACSHTSKVIAGTEAAPETVELTYRIVKGRAFEVRAVRVDGNDQAPLQELKPLTSLPRRYFLLAPMVTPDLVKLLEGRFAAYYAQHGFPSATVRIRVLDHAGDATAKDLLVQIHEGPRSFLAAVEIRVPKEAGLDPDKLGLSLAYALADHPALEGAAAPLKVPGDRRGTLGITGRVERAPDASGMSVMRLSTDKPLPQVNPDLAQVVSDLRARLASAGSPQPRVSLAFEGEEGQPRVAAFSVLVQPLDTVKRVVVRGADATRPEAIFRGLPLGAGDPLDPSKLTEAQSNLGDMGAFRRADFESLDETADGELKSGTPFTRGDLGLNLEERRPWVFTEGFGYDKSQGYHFLLGAQRLNVGGMGRTLDFGVRAGDNTLKNPTLRKWFPTGDINRSLDDYSIAYTDPWPGFIQKWFKPRIQWRTAADYIEEATATYFARRRRLTTAFTWKIGSLQTMEAGYRFERTDYGPNREGISDIDLQEIARTNKLRAVLSAPYAQWVRDARDRPYDPTEGTYFSARMDFANQIFGTAPDSSFVKLDIRQQWNWSFGYRGERGVLAATAHFGLSRPTASSAEDLPLSERFYAGGPFSVRGVEPDFLGPVEVVPLRDPSGNILYNDPPADTSPQTTLIPLGGQAMAALTLEYRFPLIGDTVWGEFFVDTGQVYSRLNAGPRYVLTPANPSAPPAGYDPSNPQSWDPSTPPPAGYAVQDQGAPFPAFRTTPGLGLIFKLGFPIKIEYAADWKRILGRPRSEVERETQLKSLLISAGFQF
ncbi:MAG TPA: BamA/TamA family outer membrane protein [Holophagaceae bacterium]|nr:BamA/TamA family outer membrane protein [Holophagaceae bacterium]